MPAGLCLRIYLSESDEIDNSPAIEAILQLCLKAGLHGVSVFRGIEGLGKHGIHSTSFIELSSHLPIIVEVIDSEEKINQALTTLQNKLPSALMATWPIQLIQTASE